MAQADPTEALSEVTLAEPRGFCAGVDRAIEIVERALHKFGAPIYVRHEIVHNTYVVDDLKHKGAISLCANPDALPFSSEKAATAIEWSEPDEKVK